MNLKHLTLCALAAGLFVAGLAWIFFTLPSWRMATPPPLLSPNEHLAPGTIATMDSAAFIYSPNWVVNSTGADPAEPDDPWAQPSGVVTFNYVGDLLALQLATGAYWGYLYVTVDGEPANLLAHIPTNPNSLGDDAGYKTFYEPEHQTAAGPSARWVRVHRAGSTLGTGRTQSHQVRVEVWRSWGQIPLRAAAVDALPSSSPIWPGVALLLAGGWLLVLLLVCYSQQIRIQQIAYRVAANVMGWERIVVTLSRTITPWWALEFGIPLACGGLLIVAASVLLSVWWLSLLGLLLLAFVALQRPTLWLAALLFGLPFYFAHPLPVLPTRALGIIDVGVLGGIVLFLAHWALRELLRANYLQANSLPTPHSSLPTPYSLPPMPHAPRLLVLLAAWALVTVFAATHFDAALREWRTIFLNAGLFAFTLAGVLHIAKESNVDRWLIVGAWLMGGTVVAAVGLWQYGAGTMLITAEGVLRVRGFYGSPNNLALYLERTLAVCLAVDHFYADATLAVVLGEL